MIRLLIVDDHPPTRIKTIDELTAGDLIKVVAEAETTDQALKLSEKLLPDIVLLDLHLPGLLGPIDLIKRLVTLRNVKVVAFASHVKGAEVQDVFDAGASGYIMKNDPPPLVRMAILMVSRGSRNITSPALPHHLTKLTAEERAVLRQITRRGGAQKAAERLGLSPQALLEIIDGVAQKLELSDLKKVTRWAKKHGF